jgi:hypothetical protein
VRAEAVGIGRTTVTRAGRAPSAGEAAFYFPLAGSLLRLEPERRSAPRHGLLPRRRVPPPNAVSGMPDPEPCPIASSVRRDGLRQTASLFLLRTPSCDPSQVARLAEQRSRGQAGARRQATTSLRDAASQSSAPCHHSATPPWSRTGVPAAASFIAPRAMLVRDLPFSPLACVSDFPGHPSAGARAPRGRDARPRPTPCRRRALLRCHAQLSRCPFFFLSFFISFLLCKLRKGAQSLFHSGPACCSQPSAPHPGSPLPSRPAATKLAHWPQIQPSNPCFQVKFGYQFPETVNSSKIYRKLYKTKKMQTKFC